MPKQNESARRLLTQVRKQGGLRAGERLGVAVSGGADSVALLRLLLELRDDLGFVPCVVHFNHKLRGKASDSDEKFTANLAAEHGLEFFVARENISAKARRERTNLEDAARRARYAFFETLVRDGRLARIAVAHTADDQAETVLAHILRGTGLAGLGGIHRQAGCVFRPLLGVRRADLRDYLRAKRQPWREDATNRDTRRMRARIRHKLMPLLEKQFQPAVVEHLCQLAELAREDEEWLNLSAQCRVMALAKQLQGEVQINVADLVGPPEEASKAEIQTQGAPELGKYHHAMSSRMVRRIIEGIKIRGAQLSASHVEVVLQLARQHHSGKLLHLPGRVEVRRDRDTLHFHLRDQHRTRLQAASSPQSYSYPVDLSSGEVDVSIVELSSGLRFRVIDWPPEGRETRLAGAVLDYRRLCLPLVVRNWRPGDAMRPVGHRERHKLARLLNEIGVNKWQKEIWPVLTCGEKLVWARGLPVAAEFSATGETREGVVITEEPKP